MKLFTQATLIAAMVVAGSAHAGLQAMDDKGLSQATGQDGITLRIGAPTLGTTITTAGGTTYTRGLAIDSVYIHDKDGRVGNSLTGQAGAITLGAGDSNMVVGSNTPIVVNVDADGNGGAPVLNVNLALGPTLIRTGAIGVAVSNRTVTPTGGTWGIGTNVNILDSLDLELGATTVNVQLGNTPQGAMIKANGQLQGGLRINNLKLTDNSPLTETQQTAQMAPGGSLYVGSIALSDSGSTNMTLAADIRMVANGGALGTGAGDRGGLLVTMGGAPLDVLISDVRLGSVDTTGGTLNAANSAASIGDIEIRGLQAAGTSILVSGH